MSGTIYSRLRVFDPDNGGKEVIFKSIEELKEILKGWLISDHIIELAYGSVEVKYVMTRDRIADHLSGGSMGEDFVRYGEKHKRAKILLDHLSKRDYNQD
jgi:hypothetical protein|tara:strand:- start:529 stop:828 length:300 start_codon:yes stop_codon:yes gene_type:complete